MERVNTRLEKIDLLGRGVRAYRIVQQPLDEGAELPAPEPIELTENARRLGAKLRDKLRTRRDSLERPASPESSS